MPLHPYVRPVPEALAGASTVDAIDAPAPVRLLPGAVHTTATTTAAATAPGVAPAADPLLFSADADPLLVWKGGR